MTVEKDAEEIFKIRYSEQNSSILDHELQDVDELQMIFMPPNDGLDSDKDDAPSGAFFFLSEFYFECQVTTLTPKKETQEKRKLTL